jgi:hypothetical protein
LKIFKIPLFALFLFLLVFPVISFGQRRIVINNPEYDRAKFHFGFVLGANQNLLTVRPISNISGRVFDSTYIPDILPMPDSAKVLSIWPTPAVGFVISIVANMRMGDNFDLRFIPSLSFGDRSVEYNVQTYRKGDTISLNISKQIPSTYINFPFEIRYKANRYNNFRPYLMAGFQYTLDLASQAKKREQRNSDEKIVKLNANDFYAEAGVGFDFYNEWFKFGVELKMLYGLTDVLKREHNIYTDAIESFKSKIFQVSFTFE